MFIFCLYNNFEWIYYFLILCQFNSIFTATYPFLLNNMWYSIPQPTIETKSWLLFLLIIIDLLLHQVDLFRHQTRNERLRKLRKFYIHSRGGCLLCLIIPSLNLLLIISLLRFLSRPTWSFWLLIYSICFYFTIFLAIFGYWFFLLNFVFLRSQSECFERAVLRFFGFTLILLLIGIMAIEVLFLG